MTSERIDDAAPHIAPHDLMDVLSRYALLMLGFTGGLSRIAHGTLFRSKSKFAALGAISQVNADGLFVSLNDDQAVYLCSLLTLRMLLMRLGNDCDYVLFEANRARLVISKRVQEYKSTRSFCWRIAVLC